MSRNKYATQGRLVIDALKKKPHTYLEMIQLGCGLSPWKRVKECLAFDEEVIVTEGTDGLVRWSVRTPERYRAVWPEFKKP